MTPPRPRSPSRRKRRGRRASSEQWLLLLGIVVVVAVLCGLAAGRWSEVPPNGVPVVPLTRAQARASNAAVPFVRRRATPAARYVFRGGPAARAQAVECLATAALYEAGQDRTGQRAVIQVVLNRVRVPGYPKTICGVVYKGAERITGCQFSFTCDGSLIRRPERDGWRAARQALRGDVFARVGRATHYHTDWVVPYWRSSMDKIAQVDTHIFYRRHCRICPVDRLP